MRRDRRSSDRLEAGLVQIACLMLAIGFMLHLSAQSQDAINARIEERVAALIERVQKLETAQNYGLGALALNLGAHLVQIRSIRRRQPWPPPAPPTIIDPTDV